MISLCEKSIFSATQPFPALYCLPLTDSVSMGNTPTLSPYSAISCRQVPQLSKRNSKKSNILPRDPAQNRRPKIIR